MDKSLNEDATDKIKKYRSDYKNRPSNVIYFMPAISSTSGRIYSEFIRILFLQDHRETDHFFQPRLLTSSLSLGVPVPQPTQFMRVV